MDVIEPPGGDSIITTACCGTLYWWFQGSETGVYTEHTHLMEKTMINPWVWGYSISRQTQVVPACLKERERGTVGMCFFFPLMLLQNLIYLPDVAARSHLYAYLKISSSRGHKKQDMMHMHNEKLNKAINDSMPVLLHLLHCPQGIHGLLKSNCLLNNIL